MPLAHAAGLPIAATPPDEAGELLADQARSLAVDLGIPRGLGALGVRAEDVDTLATTALADARLTTNPRQTSRDDLVALFRAAL